MLPTFPSIVEFRHKESIGFLKDRIGHHSPIHREIKSHIQHEGRQALILRQDDEPDPTMFVEASAEVLVKRKPMRDFHLSDVLRSYDDAAKQFAKQQAEMLVNKLHEVTEKTGNVVDAAGEKLNSDMILRVYETMELSFDEYGQWQRPVFWGGSKASADLVRIESDPEFQRRLADLVNRKRSEFRRREADRVLVG